MAGFVYVMTNQAFPSLVKIGRSSRDPTIDRVSELNQTGVPFPFKVEYYAFVSDAERVESLVHLALAKFRPNKSREFFEISVADAIFYIRDIVEKNCLLKYEEINYVPLSVIEERRTEIISDRKKLQEQLEQAEITRREAEKRKRAEAERLSEQKIRESFERRKKDKEGWIRYFKGFSIQIGAYLSLILAIAFPPLLIPGVATFFFLLVIFFKKRY